jgi:hypothetical protein
MSGKCGRMGGGSATNGVWGTVCRLVLTWGALVASAPLAHAQNDAEPARTTYRRVYVPEADLDGQVRGLLPIRREEFDQHISVAATRGPARFAPPRARLTAARYSARLAGESLVGGRAWWSVETSGSEPTVLQASPCNLALEEAVWEADPQSGGASQPAVLGNDPAGDLVCLTPRSGTLALRWSLAAADATADRLDFRLQLPPVPLTRLEIELPPAMVLRCDAGLVIPPARGKADDAEGDVTAGAAAAAGSNVVWAIETAGTANLLIRIERSVNSVPAKPVVLVQESGNYRVLAGEIDISSSLELDVLSAPLRELDLLVDRQVRLVSIRLGDEPLAWEETPRDDSTNDPTDRTARGDGKEPELRRITVQLARPLRGEGIRLDVAGVAPWPANQAVRLPRIQVLDGVWQEGQATIEADPSVPVSIDGGTAGWQTSFNPAAASRPVDQWQFQYAVPVEPLVAALVVGVPPLVESSGTSITFEASQISATLTAELSVDRGECFSVSAQIPTGWILDSVEVLPSDAQEDRQLVTRSKGPHALQIDLRRPIVPGRPLVVTLRARRRRPAMELWMSVSSLQLARFNNVRSSRRLWSINLADSTVSLASRGDEQLRRLDPAALSDQERRLFPAPLGPLVVQCDQRSDAWEFRLEAARPRYQAEVAVRVEVEPSGLRQTARLRCIPAGTAVARMSVRLSPPPQEAVQWRIRGEEGRELTAQLRDAPVAEEGREAVYELLLARPRQAPFEMEATWSVPGIDPAGSYPVVLAAFQEAETQTGSLEVYAPQELPLVVRGQRLRPAPISSLDESDDSQLLRASYRYAAEQPGEVRVQLVPREQSLSGGWVESLVLHSEVLPDGFVRHEAALKLQQAGAAAFVFRLPAGSQSPRAVVDDEPVTVEVEDSAAGVYRIPLAPASASDIRITATSQMPPLGWRLARTWTIPTLSCDLPVLSSRWQLTLPPELRVVRSAQGIATPAPTGFANLPGAGDPSDDGKTNDAETMVGLATRQAGSPSPLELPWDPSTPATLTVYAPYRILAWSWCLALLAGSIAWFDVTRRPAGVVARFLAGSRCVLATAVAASLALLLPPYLAPLLWGTVAGLLVGAAGGILSTSWAAKGPSADLRGERSHARRAVASALLALAILAGGGRVAEVARGAAPGDELQFADPPTPAGGYKVVMPVDAQRQPAGDYVFVEPPLYDLLVQRSNSSATDLPAWIVRSAAYRVLEGERLTWEIDVESQRPETTLRLPLVRGEVTLVEGESRLDGRPVVPRWAATDDHLEVVLPESGRHRLEIRLAFSPRLQGSQRVAELRIPRLAFASISAPATIRGLKIGERSGDVLPSALVSLGPTDRLKMSWPAAAAGSDSLPSAAVTEGRLLLLWRIRPGSVVAHASVRVTPLSGEVSEVELAIDPRLRVLPLSADSPVADFQVAEGAGENRLRLRLAQPAAGPLQLQFSMLWVGASGIGNLSLPRVELLTDRPSSTVTALSLASGLAWKTEPHEVADSDRADSDRADFLSAWGAPLPAGISAAEAGELIVAGKDETLVSTIPSSAPLSAAQTIDYTLAGRSLTIDYAAELSQPNRELWQHRVAVPPELEVTSLALWADDHPVDVRWLRDASGLVTVVATEPPAADQRLEIKAEQPFVAGESIRSLPELSYVGSTSGSLTARIYRHADVQVSVAAPAAQWQPVEFSADSRPGPDPLARLVGAFRDSDPAAADPLQVRSSPNQPRCEGTLITRLIPQAGGWEVELECRIAVASGLVDTVELELAQSIGEPLRIEPAMDFEVVTREAGTLRSLLLRPSASVADALVLRVRGSLLSSGPSLLPAINLPQVKPLRQLVELPAAIAGEPAVWQLTGLQPLDLAQRPIDLPAPPDGALQYEVIGEHPQAVLQRSPAKTPAAGVLLAEHLVLFPAGDRRSIASLAVLDVLPAGNAEVAVQVPPGLRLIEVLVEGRESQPVYRGGGVWDIPLADTASPQRLEIAAEGVLPASSGRLQKLPLVRVVGDDPSGQIVRLADSPAGTPTTRFASPEEAAVLRLEQMTDARALAAQLPAANFSAEYRAELLSRWAIRWQAANQASPLAEELALTNDLMSRVTAAREKGALLDAVDEAGGIWNGELPASVPRGSFVSSTLADSLDRLATREGDWRIAIGPDEIWLDNPPPPLRTNSPGIWWAMGVLVAGWLASRLLLSRPLAERGADRLALTIAVGGLALLVGAAQLLLATTDTDLTAARVSYLLLGAVGLALLGGATRSMGTSRRSPADRSHSGERSALR